MSNLKSQISNTSDLSFAKVMIVDDVPGNLHVLEELLSGAGCQVFALTNGPAALRAAAKTPPDLILLDVFMPEMDGYEVCRRLKADANLADIPVIFISALNEPMDKVKAFEVGAVDYVTKPFSVVEVHARVATHVALHRAQGALARGFSALQDLEQLRDNLVSFVVHDMMNALLCMDWPLKALRTELGPRLDDEQRKMLDIANESSGRLLAMATSLLDVSRLEGGKLPLELAPCDLRDLVVTVVAEIKPAATEVSLVYDAPAACPIVQCDCEVIRRVLVNLVYNGLKRSGNKGDVRVAITVGEEGKSGGVVDGKTGEGTVVRVSVTDRGRPVAPEHYALIFEKFGMTRMKPEDRWYSGGLGLAFCKLAIEAHGGSIGVESGEGGLTAFWFEYGVHR